MCQWVVEPVGKEAVDVPRASVPLRVVAPALKPIVEVHEVDFDHSGMPLGNIADGALDTPGRNDVPDRHVYLGITTVTSDCKCAAHLAYLSVSMFLA